MTDQPYFDRLEILTGPHTISRLAHTKVAVFGLGGVGSWAAEGLVRSGIGEIMLVDYDVIDATNINRQLQSHSANIGKPKTEELASRLALINPQCRVQFRTDYYSDTNAESFALETYDFVLDCIDHVPSKVDLLMRCTQFGTTVMASMGAAFRLDPTQIRTSSIWQTTGCGLAKFIRRKLKDGSFVGDFQVVYSPEPMGFEERKVKGSAVFVTACFGMTLAGMVIKAVSDPE